MLASCTNIPTGPSYQAGAFLRPALTLAAWACARPELHRASIKALNAFGYARLLIHFLGPLVKTRNEDTAQGKHKYNMSILLSALLAVSESGFQYAVPFYVLMVVLIAWLNRCLQRRSAVEKRNLCRGGSSSLYAHLQGLRKLKVCGK